MGGGQLMDSNIYIVFDGSSLISQIRQLQDQQGIFKGNKLDPLLLVTGFTSALTMRDFMGSAFRRAIFYFADGDTQIEEYLTLPDSTKPHLIRDVEFRFCGTKLARSAKYDEFLRGVPDDFLDRCQKSEKGVDIEICCDALQLAAAGQLDRLFLLTNDSDYVPLCRKIKQLGANISLLGLSDARPVNRDLAQACDSYDILDPDRLFQVFGLSADAEQRG